jgi:hypothetical protein
VWALRRAGRPAKGSCRLFIRLRTEKVAKTQKMAVEHLIK